MCAHAFLPHGRERMRRNSDSISSHTAHKIRSTAVGAFLDETTPFLVSRGKGTKTSAMYDSRISIPAKPQPQAHDITLLFTYGQLNHASVTLPSRCGYSTFVPFLVTREHTGRSIPPQALANASGIRIAILIAIGSRFELRSNRDSNRDQIALESDLESRSNHHRIELKKRSNRDISNHDFKSRSKSRHLSEKKSVHPPTHPPKKQITARQP